MPNVENRISVFGLIHHTHIETHCQSIVITCNYVHSIFSFPTQFELDPDFKRFFFFTLQPFSMHSFTEFVWSYIKCLHRMDFAQLMNRHICYGNSFNAGYMYITFIGEKKPFQFLILWKWFTTNIDSVLRSMHGWKSKINFNNFTKDFWI